MSKSRNRGDSPKPAPAPITTPSPTPPSQQEPVPKRSELRNSPAFGVGFLPPSSTKPKKPSFHPKSPRFARSRPPGSLRVGGVEGLSPAAPPKAALWGQKEPTGGCRRNSGLNFRVLGDGELPNGGLSGTAAAKRHRASPRGEAGCDAPGAGSV